MKSGFSNGGIRTEALSVGAAVAIAFVVLTFAVVEKAKPESDEPQYLSPYLMVASPDGRWLYVACERSNELRVVDVSAGKVVKSLAVGRVPRGVALSADGRQVYVTNT